MSASGLAGLDVKGLYDRGRLPLWCSIGTYLVGGGLGVIVVLLGDPTQLADVGTVSSSDERVIESFTVFTVLTTNLTAVGIMMSGSVLFGSTTVVTLLMSGLMHSSTAMVLSLGPLEAVVLYLPHGIFELPAIWMAGAIGFRVPYEFVLYMREKQESVLTADVVRDSLVLAGASIGLLIVAAFVEVHVTPRIAEAVLY